MIRITGASAARARRAAAEVRHQSAAAEAARRQAWPVWIWLPRIMPMVESTPSGCGCGRA